MASAGRPPGKRERERGRTLLTIDKQSGARADDGGVANDTAAAVDSISIPLGGRRRRRRRRKRAKDGQQHELSIAYTRVDTPTDTQKQQKRQSS